MSIETICLTDIIEYRNQMNITKIDTQGSQYDT